MIPEWQKPASEDLESQVFFIAQSIGPTLNHSGCVVQSPDETERKFVLGITVSGAAVPVSLAHAGELLVGF